MVLNPVFFYTALDIILDYKNSYPEFESNIVWLCRWPLVFFGFAWVSNYCG